MSDASITFLVLAVTVALFVSDRLRLDVVAMLALLALTLSGVLPANDALAGFSNPVVLMIAGLFVVGAGLSETGVADWLGRQLGKVAGVGEARLVAVVMLATAALSAFMSSTGTVAILLPVVGTLAQSRGVAPGRVLMPLAFASLLGGMLTLIGTPPNLVVSGALREAGHEPFRFFSFAGPGLVMLALGVLFMIYVGSRLLPGRAVGAPLSVRALTLADLAREYGVASELHTLRVAEGAKLAGSTLADSNLRADWRLTVVGIAHGKVARAVLPRVRFEVGDVLSVQGSEADVARAAEAWGLERLADPSAMELPPEESLAEIVIPRRSRLVGRTLRESKFRDRQRATVLAVRRGGADGGPAIPATPAIRDVVIHAGDTLLVKGRVKHLRNLRDERRDFVLVAEPDAAAGVLVDKPRAYAAIAITFAMLVVMTFGLLPNVVAVLAAAVAMVLTTTVRAPDAYRSINWESVVLIAGVLPLATALDRSGGMKIVVDALVGALGGAGPYVVLAALFVLTSLFSQIISNTATTVLVAPIAVSIATALGIAPHPLLMGVAIGASTAFATPIASPVNTLVLGPGGYRFADFFKVGLPMQLLLLAATLLVVPWFFPF